MRWRVPLALLLLAVLAAVALLVGTTPALMLLPFLVLALPLFADRYPGADRLLALGRRSLPGRRPVRRARWTLIALLGASRAAFGPAVPPRGPPSVAWT